MKDNISFLDDSEFSIVESYRKEVEAGMREGGNLK